MRMFIPVLALAALLALAPRPCPAQEGGFMECSACQILLDLSASSAPPGAAQVEVDTKPCTLLDAADQKACTQFFTTYGPRFIKAVQKRRAQGESYHQMCARMGYCPR